MSDRPTITQQYAFTVNEDGETDGGLEPSEETVETSLETFGADVDHRERDSRVDQPEATSFGVDDRPEVTSSDGGEQGALFVQADDDQRTLTGERATSQCLFGSDDNDESNEPNEAAIDDELAPSVSDEATTRAVATDGGHVEDHDDDERDDRADEDEDDRRSVNNDEDVIVPIPRRELASVADALDAERRTIERNAGTGPRTEKLAGCVEECHTGLSLLDDSDEHGTISRAATAAIADELQAAANTETGDYAEELQRLADVLRRALDGQPPNDEDTDRDGDGDVDRESDTGTLNESDHDDTFDANEETVTDAWEGAYISAQWGYGQTNVELAQIIEVSGSGKTVLARRVGAERVGHGRTSTQLRPNAEQYGDEFRLHVRNVSGDPAFRGSYPLGSDADMDGPTRRGSFYPFDNDPENSIRETRTGFGH